MSNDEQNYGFIKLNRGSAFIELSKDKNAYVLFSIIATRARRESGTEPHKGLNVFLEKNMCFIGDYYNCGLTKSEYNTAKKHLSNLHYVEFNTTHKGTIAKLLDNPIFDINSK